MASGMKWSSSYWMAAFGSRPARLSMSFLSACVKDVEGRTVAVHPDTQMVVVMLAWVTSAKKAPGGSVKGER